MLAALFFASLGAAPPSEAAPPASDLLASIPRDAVLALVIEDFGALWEDAQASSWASVARDPALDPLWPPLDAFFRRKWKVDELTVVQALDALESAAFFATDLGQDDRESMGLVVAVRPDSGAVLEALAAGLRERGEPVQHDGRAFTAERGGHSHSFEVSFTWSRGVAMVEGRGRESTLELAATLARSLDGGGADDGGLAARLTAARPAARPATRAALEGYLDVGALVSAPLDGTGAKGRRAFEALALDDFGWGALHLTAGEGPGLDLDATLELPRTGLFPLLTAHARPVTSTFAHLAPTEAIEVSALNYDVQGAWKSLKAWLAVELPDVAEELARDLQGVSGSAGIDVERDLIGQLTGELGSILIPLPEGAASGMHGAVYSLLVGLLGAPGSAAASVHVVGLQDVGLFEDLVDALVEMSSAGAELVEHEVGGHWMVSFEMPEAPLSPTWAFTDDALLLSLYREPVRAVLERASDESRADWSDAPGRSEALVPGSAFGTSVADLPGLAQARLVSPLAELARLYAEGLGPQDEGLSPEAITGVAEALPGLVAQHVAGTARTTVSFEGRVLRYRFRAQ